MRPPRTAMMKPTKGADAPRPMGFQATQPTMSPAPEAFFKSAVQVLPPQKYIGINTDPGMMTLRCRDVNAYRFKDDLRGNGVAFDDSPVVAHPIVGNNPRGLLWNGREGVLGLPRQVK